MDNAQKSADFGAESLIPTMKPLDSDKKAADAAQNAPEAAAPAEEAKTEVTPEPIDFSNVQIEPLFTDYVDFDTFSKSDFRAVKVLACEAVLILFPDVHAQADGAGEFGNSMNLEIASVTPNE